MRAGYVTLFGFFLAYSAYQGSKPSSSNPAASSAAATSSGRLNSSHDIEALPTISGGVCNRPIDNDGNYLCDGCGPICPAEELHDLIQDYFQPGVPEQKEEITSKPKNEKTQDDRSKRWGVPSGEEKYIKFVIASLADPVHTHLALFFDRQIEAIEKAAQAEGYLFSRSWMPWDISTHPEANDFTVRMAQAEVQSAKEKLPGLMIFRKPGSHNDQNTLFVFVVGESPTGGIHAEQFQNALHIRKAIETPDSSNPQDSLLIFGPTFSGSLHSLDLILKNHRNEFPKILIRSGTVSSFAATHAFCEALRRPDQWPDSAKDPGKPDFVTFQFSDAYEEFYLSTFFADRHELHSRVAVLSEDETQYGNLEIPEDKKPSDDPNHDPCQPRPPKPLLPLTRVYFPREIAQLRSAYEQNIKLQSPSNPENYAPPQRGLPLTLGVTGNDDDSVPVFAPLQTPLSQDAIMQAIVSTLRNQHAKVVIIRAGDPLDMVFLARYLRRNYPQARLVTAAADLLMVYDVADPRFHGILAVTTYPLFNGADFPSYVSKALAPDTQPEPVQQIFSDSFTLGSFNAVLSILTPSATDSDLSQLPAAAYVQFGLPSFLVNGNSWRPHLWLTTVGRDGYWPVSVLDGISKEKINSLAAEMRAKMGSSYPKDIPDLPEATVRSAVPGLHPLFQPRFSVHFTVGWLVLWLFTLAITLLFAFLLTCATKYSQSEIVARFGPSSSKSHNQLLFAGCALAILSQSLFVFPVVVWLKCFSDVSPAHWRSASEFLNGMWLVFLMYVLSVGALILSWRKRQTKLDFSLWSFGLPVLAVLAAAAVALTFFVPWTRFGSGLYIFVYRYIYVGSGVSPLLPIAFALAAWMWWWWQSLTGVVSTEGKQVIPPAPSAFDTMSGDPDWKYLVREPYDRVRLKHLTFEQGQWPWNSLAAIPIRTHAITILAVIGFLGIYALMRPGEIAEAFESIYYRRVFWPLLYSCLFLVCYSSSHIAVLWMQLRKLLRAIEALPFHRGFSDVRNLTWKPLWKLAGAGQQQFAQVLRQQIAALSEIENLDPECPLLRDAVAGALERTQDVSGVYERLEAGQRVRDQMKSKFNDLQKQMAAVAASALIYATEKGKEETSWPADDSNAGKDGKPATSEPPASDETLRAVEHFLCLFYLNMIIVPLRRLQTLILALAGVFVFVLLSYSSYPFESRESFHALLISILFAISLVVGIVYGQMYSDPLLSRITNTTPGDLGLDFWIKLGTFVFVPVLSLLSVQFPEVNSLLFSWLQPALQSLK